MNRSLPVLVAACALALPTGAQAAFPGANGSIVFDRGGSIVAAPDRVLSESGYDHGPSVSPDGTQIAYAVNRDIYVSNIDGSARRAVTTDGQFATDPAWSPDGKSIVYAASGLEDRSDLYVKPVAGGAARALTATGQHSERFPDWSPDGTRIAYERTGCDTPYGGGTCVFVVAAAGGAGANLTPEDSIPGCENQPGYYQNGATGEPSWSPDGRRIVYTGPLHCDVGTLGSDLWVMAADGSGKVQLNADNGTNDQTPAFSPDGTQITFMSDREGDVPRIYVTGSGGGGITAVSNGTTDRNPYWAPAVKVCRVPPLKAKTKAEATASLKTMGCKLGKVVKKKSKATKPGTVLKLGAKVKVKLAS